MAKLIAERTGAELFEVEPDTPYPENYLRTTEVVEEEFTNGSTRRSAAPVPDLSGFDTIFIGHPIWWGRMPPVFTQALEAADFSGKTIHHFCTHEGSGFGSTESELHRAAKGAMFGGSLAVQGTQVDRSASKIDVWLNKLGF